MLHSKVNDVSFSWKDMATVYICKAKQAQPKKEKKKRNAQQKGWVGRTRKRKLGHNGCPEWVKATGWAVCFRKFSMGTFLVVQWLRLSHCRGPSIPGWGTEILHETYPPIAPRSRMSHGTVRKRERCWGNRLYQTENSQGVLVARMPHRKTSSEESIPHLPSREVPIHEVFTQS